ncbi:unnamed protein product [Acanthoscelides obtectus]|uniref:Uncharacterized protein n=1 Tax=Acanthoscelides obtectus TaxID=200917 RepID=A0A9P0K273_ACAOB|nr:unnamed protein product [Acanthoscelides obtectus]CAK1623754.1 hypothetical protein AOBTE_LOCUS2156 [Acanthoscelides obtectus]
MCDFFLRYGMKMVQYLSLSSKFNLCGSLLQLRHIKHYIRFETTRNASKLAWNNFNPFNINISNHKSNISLNFASSF